jgi:hypothetical protein
LGDCRLGQIVLCRPDADAQDDRKRSILHV